jgi:hypothetical protein
MPTTKVKGADKSEISFGFLPTLRRATEIIKKQVGDFKLSVNYLRELSARPQASDYDIATEVRSAIKRADEIEALGLFNMCDDGLRALVLVPRGSLDIHLFSKLNLGGEEVGEAFLAIRKLGPVKLPLVANSQPRFFSEKNLANELMGLILQLSLEDAEKMLEKIGYKIIYLVVASEIENYTRYNPGQDRHLLLALSLDAEIPPHLYFLQTVKDRCPLIFQHIVLELNAGWPEFRQKYYKLQ